MKIVLIGPVYPYKGGIAQYTSQLFSALKNFHDVYLISYKMMYPKLLFKKEQRDYSNEMFKIDETQFLINTANPLNIFKVSHKINEMKPECVLIQWWHPYFAPCYKILTTFLSKNIKVIFTCHNVFPHERFPMDKFLTKMTLKKADGYIVHSRSDANELKTIKDNPRYIFSPLPTYETFKHRELGKEEALRELNSDINGDIDCSDIVLLFFGLIRDYKGLKHLINALPYLKNKHNNIKLIIAGSFGDDKNDYLELIRQNELEEIVFVVDAYIPDDEVDRYFEASDLVVLPYESATQSAVVQAAFGFEKPVIVTNVGGLPDVVEHMKTGYVIEAKNAKAIANSIEDFIENKRYEEMHQNIINTADIFSWNHMVESIEKLVNEIN
jgi:glycosyltransferase involved in cell wall biosynthesis